MSARPAEGTVFVVDDDPAVLESVSTLLRAAGLPVEAFLRADEFLRSIGPERAGCLVLDIRMPDLSGLELQERLVGRGITTPVIIITGHGDVPLAVRAIKRGALDFIEKPFDPATLLRRVREAMAYDAEARRLRARRRGIEARLARLTPREAQILRRIAAGLHNREVAAELGITVSTVEVHRSNLMDKLGARSVADLVRLVAYAEELEEPAPHHRTRS